MKVLCFGSLNIDYTYSVEHFVEAGETLASSQLNVFSGGKGLNQSVALARAGAEVFHAGTIGEEGIFLTEELRSSGVDTSYIKVRKNIKTGHAIIQRDKNGGNCILLYGGANRSITRDEIDFVLSHFESGDFLVLQNEINELEYIISRASEQKMKIVLNPSPMDNDILRLPLELVDIFVLNEVEAAQILGISEINTDKSNVIKQLAKHFPKASIVLTMGAEGSVYYDREKYIEQEAYKVKTVDTTGAGDTFTGYLIAAVMQGETVEYAMKLASKAASIAVARNGASPSIPEREEVNRIMD